MTDLAVPAAPAILAAPPVAVRRGTVAGVGMILGSGLSVQFGAAVATTLFPRTGVTGVVTLRLAVAAVILLLVCRPSARGYTRSDWAVIGAFGAVLATMNTLFYEAIQRIPLGPAVTLEVLGPLVLSVVSSRRAASWLWALLALVGVALLGYRGFDQLNVAGVCFAFGAGALWAAYIVLNAGAGRRFRRVDGVAFAMLVAGVLSLPLGIVNSGGAILRPSTLALGVGVAVLSSVLPYTLDLQALRRLPTSTFAVLMSLTPAIATFAGWAVLRQALTLPEAAAIVLVITASIGAVRMKALSTGTVTEPMAVAHPDMPGGPLPSVG